MADALTRIHVLRDLHAGYAAQAIRSEVAGHTLQPRHRVLAQLAGTLDLADLVAFLPEEAHAAPAGVEPRAHSIPRLRRTDHLWRRGQFHLADPRERVAHH